MTGEKERVVVRFAGDSGDGIQLAGDRFAAATALIGNDLVTLPDFPAEIRAPAGTLAGVSAFQIHFASRDILTPGGQPNVLVAMNPAALKVNLPELERGGIVIANEDGFTDHNLRKAEYEANPLEDGTLDDYQVFRVPMTSMTVRATEGIDGITARDAARSKNFFALGLVSWMYSRPTDVHRPRGSRRSSARAGRSCRRTSPRSAPATTSARPRSCCTSTTRSRPPRPSPAPTAASTARPRRALGLIAASVRSGLPLFLASYPITPASELLHELSRHRRFGVRTVQAEDEIAAANMALGAAFGGQLGVTATSGPGMDLKAGDDRPRGRAGAAAAGDRRPAGRAIDRDADQDRGRRPADGHPRPPRRVAAADRRRRDAGPVLRRGASRRSGSRSPTGPR